MSPQAPHGHEYEYRSILTDVLGWVIERVTGEPLAQSFARAVWQPMGAEHDADLVLGPAGFALVDGGFCVTLGDLARYGLLHLHRGSADGRRVVSDAWVSRVVGHNPGLAAQFDSEREGMPDSAYYRDKWWVIDPDRGARSGFRDPRPTGPRRRSHRHGRGSYVLAARCGRPCAGWTRRGDVPGARRLGRRDPLTDVLLRAPRRDRVRLHARHAPHHVPLEWPTATAGSSTPAGTTSERTFAEQQRCHADVTSTRAWIDEGGG